MGARCADCLGCGVGNADFCLRSGGVFGVGGYAGVEYCRQLVEISENR